MDGDGADVPHIHGVESSGARGDGMEEGGEQLTGIGLARMQAELADPDSKGTEEDETKAYRENESGVDAQSGVDARGVFEALIAVA